MVNNPSELARLEEELKELKRLVKGGVFPEWVYEAYPQVVDKGYKSVKQELVKEIWRIELTLGIQPSSYNSSDWGKDYDQ